MTEKSAELPIREPVVRRTLTFMLKTAWREKPSLFFSYLGLFFGEFVATMKKVLLPKLLIDELVLVVEGAALSAHLRQIVSYAALIVGLDFLVSLLKGFMEKIKNTLREWFDEYFQVMLADQAMKMDFEHTEDPAALD